MTQKLCYLIVCLIALESHGQSVGINTTSPHASALLDLRSSTKGLLIPRTSSVTRVAITNPAKGLMIYDTVTSSLWTYTGTQWLEAVNMTNTWSLNGNNPATENSFIGTTNAMPLRLRMNNVHAGIIDSATSNTAIGYAALRNPSTATSTTAFGNRALERLTTGLNNTAIGMSAMRFLTTGENNTAIGTAALYNNNGVNNIAVGVNAGAFMTGSFNLAVGNGTLISTIGDGNTAVGNFSLEHLQSGNSNAAFGYSALRNTTGAANTGLGTLALTFNVTGTQNTAVGYYAMRENVTGTENIGIGHSALYANVSGSYNIGIGLNSGTHPNYSNLNNTVGILNNGYLNQASNQVILGNFSTTYIGGLQPWSSASDMRFKTNIREDVSGLAFIMKLRPVTYQINIGLLEKICRSEATPDFPEKYDIEKITQTGFLAQEVDAAAKSLNYDFNAVKKMNGTDGMYALSYELFVVPLVKGMQEQQLLLDKLRAELEEIKAEIRQLKMVKEAKQ